MEVVLELKAKGEYKGFEVGKNVDMFEKKEKNK